MISAGRFSFCFLLRIYPNLQLIFRNNEIRYTYQLTMDEFKDSMKDIYTTSVLETTIDEAPMAYKDAEGIVDNIEDTVEILRIVKPVYNFKASS